MRKIVAGIVGILLILASLQLQPAKSTPGGPTCLVPTDYATIGAALAVPGCTTIIVAAGTYNENITINRNLTLQGAGAGVSTINGNGVVPAVWIGNVIVSMTGFTVTGGTNGIHCDGCSGTISNNTVSGNNYGIYAFNSATVTITGNLIASNNGDGIGTNASSPTITNNTITENGSKGIMNSSSSPTIANNTITGNNTGIENENSSSPTITSNTIRGNIGGIYSSYSSNPTITNNIIAGNSSDGIWNSDSSNPTITNNTIVGNKDGIYCRNSSNPTITNNIFASNTRYGINASSGSTPTNTYNDVWGNGTADYIGTSGGTGSISANPLFSSMSPYHLLCGSPAIDAGKDYPPNGIPPGMPPDDKDGVTRPIGAHYDMGAYEGCVMEPRPKPQLPSLLPVAQNNISQGNGFLKQANDLLSQAKAKGADTAQCEKVVTEAKELLDKAKASLTNPIYANNLALQALEKLKQAVDCLKALLG